MISSPERFPRGPHRAFQNLRPSLCGVCVLGMIAPLPKLMAEGRSSAPQQLTQLSLEQLGQVKITSVSKDPETVQQTPAAVYVITQEDIRRSGATTIPEALRLAPGVEVARIDADHWSVAIRGFAGQFSKNLLVLIDGRSVYSLLYSGVYWDAQNVMLQDVDRIEVIRGPGGTIWGANAVNGVINIITKNATQTHGLVSNLGGGNVDQGTGNLRYGGELKNGLNYRVYAMGDIRGPEYHPNSDNFDDSRLGQIGFRTDWTRGLRDAYTVQGDLYRGQTGESGLVTSFSPIAEVTAQGQTAISGGNLMAHWKRTFGEGSDIQIKAYFDRTNRSSFELGETRDTFDVDYVQHARLPRNQELTWGLGATISPSLFIQTSAGVDFLPHQQTDTIYSSFLQYEAPLVANKLNLTMGTKLEHNNFSGFDYQPSIRLLWTPSRHQSVWASITRAVRTPSRIDQDVVFDIVLQATPPPPIFFQIQGNPNQKAEQLIATEAGYRAQLGGRLYLDFAGFYNTYRDLEGYGPIGLAETTNPPPLDLLFVLPYANSIEGRTAGAEIAPVWNVTQWWRLRGSYSFLHMDLKDKPGYTDVGNLLETYTGSSPSHVANVQSIFTLPRGLEFSQTYRYSSQLPEYAIHPYNTADAQLAWSPRERLGLSFNAQNLLRPSHPEFGGDPGPLVGIKRSFYISLHWML